MLFSGKCGMICLNLVKEWRQHELHFSYCPYCGSKLIGKEIGDEELFLIVKTATYLCGICLPQVLSQPL